ncbi:site-specific integrase [Bergeyella zoohelcum]|uniref:Tyrosine recombinase XerD n=1 Tax=Bergeyella zoohelcum TaxID=1015 RepID=A0A376BYG2_9FLAO|nr:site-specific integrase [Bergeyella zoohelcum]EKB61394.1 hypothetical protein HMPREF9700_00889 [Bergeyella zoohelcum CCUG 30536]SSZ46514.1 Tyrosine recombinase XerD [Bergeyella zoohelcum]
MIQNLPIIHHQAVSKSFFTAMNIKFYVREYINKEGKSQVYMSITSQGKRKRVPVDIYVNPINWDDTKQRVKNKTENAETINLLLDQMSARISDIRIHYRLSNLHLSIDKLLEELKSKTPNYDFLAFMQNYLDNCVMKAGSYKKNISEINKLREFKSFIPFSDITLQFVDKYKAWLSNVKKNAPTTIAFSIKTMLKYIRVAKKYGIFVNIDPDMVKAGSTKGNRVNLNIQEVNRLKSYYQSEFIKPSHKLALGYFLFSCYTSLRISDIKSLSREDVMGDFVYFTIKKTNKIHTIPLNKSAKSIVENHPQLFISWRTEQKMNEVLKDIAAVCGIRKKIHFHVARHSFATNFLRKGGKVEDLQVIMGHSDLKTTMVYVHMIKSESVTSIYLLDD